MAYDIEKPLSAAEYRDALWKGLGRTVLFVQRYGDADYREEIVRGCICDLRFDRQTMQDHSDQLFDIIVATGASDWYINHLTEVLPTLDSEQFDPWQAVAVLRRFAESGALKARAAVIEAFDRDAANGNVEYLDDLLLVEGAQGLVRAARSLPWQSIKEDDQWRVWGAVEQWSERDGHDAVRAQIRALLPAPTQLRPRFEYLEAKWLEVESRRDKRSWSNPVPTYDELVGLLDARVRRGRESVLTYLFLPMKNVSPETVERLGRDLLDESDPLRRLGLVKAFRHRPFPFGHEPLMPFLESADEDLRFVAMQALAKLRHPDIRQYALEGERTGLRPDLVAEMLKLNALPEDESVLLDFARRELDPKIYHSVTIGLLRLMESHSDIRSREICFQLYERGACSMCRTGIVDLLMKSGPLPEWISAELPYDSERHTRELMPA